MRRRHLILALLAVAFFAGCAYIDNKQGEWIFRPTESTWWGARPIPASFVERDIPIVSDGKPTGETVHSWWAPVENPNAPVLLYLHGARWNLTGSVTRIPRWNNMGFSVLAIDYRGFGKSSPRTPSEQSAYEDAETAWAYLKTLAPNSRRFIFGHSLGGAMATHLAIKDPSADGLILEATFTNIPDMVRGSAYGFLPVSGLITQRFDNLDRIDDVKVPVLIAHGTDDSIVPYKMGETLFAAATSRKRFFSAAGGNHHNMTSRFYEEYAQAVREHFALNPAQTQGSARALGQNVPESRTNP